MNKELQEYIDSLAKIRDDLNTLIPEGHALLKDMTKLRKEIREDITSYSSELVKAHMDEAIGIFMNDYLSHIQEQLKISEAAIVKKFDSIYNILMGSEKIEEVPMEVLLLAKGTIEQVIREAAKKMNVIVFENGGELPEALKNPKKRKIKFEGNKPNWHA